jgi:ATP-dependent helicase/nuclease subunit A
VSAELTGEQRAAVEAAGPVAITAGAGTGKTHTLGHRYVEHVVRGVSPLSIVAITFTKLAANELRARVRQYAEARLGEAHPALSELEAAPIGTVHALCFRIAQDFPVEAGVPPNVRLLDPLEGDIWRVDALTEVMRNLPPEAFEHLPYDQLERILKVLLENPHEAQQALQHEPAGALSLLAGEVATLRQEHLGSDAFGDDFATLQGLHSEHEDKLETLRKDLIAAVRLVEQGSLAEVEALLYRRRSKVGTQKVWGDALLPLQAACDTVLKAVRDYVRHPLLSASWEHADDVFKAAYPHVRRAFTAALERIEAAKTRGGVLDFSDIERAALRALEHPHVREHYARRWSVLLLDEAQDTSPIQDALIAHLAVFTTLTVVGDAKQSIYRFRGADPAVFARMQQRVHDAQGQAVQLQVSFRSRAPLVASVNTLFEDVLGDAHEPLEAAAQHTDAQHADAQHTDASLPAVSAWSTTLDEERPSAARLGLAEAHRIAEELSQLLSSGRTVRGKDGVPRPVKASDVAVLARSWTTLDTISEILPAYGVPVLHGGGGNLLETPEARDGIAALRFAADPRDDVALLALLRGPMFAVPDPDLMRHRDAVAELKPASFWDGLQATPEASLKEAAAQLDSWLQGAATLPPTDLLADLDERTGWSGVAANLPGGPRRLADRAGFVSLVASLERSGLDVFAVARRLRRLVELNVDVARPKLQAGNAVTLMSVHGSKGLEWPVVVLAGMDRASSGRAPDVIVDHERGVAFAVATHAEYRAEPVLLKVLKHREQQAAEAEARRLWYVAVTRAADWVVFSHGPKANYDMKLFADGLEDIGAAAEVKVVPPGRARWPEGAAGGVTYDGVELPEPTLSAQEK